MTTEDECDYIMSSNNARKNVIYTPKEGSQIIFDPKGNWWGGSLIGTAYTEFNGVKLVAVQNSNTTSKPQYCRLCIGNITSMTTTAMADAQIMDSRLDNYDPAFGPTGPNGNNSSLTGMTSFYNAIGENPNSTGDIAIGHSADGNSIQVYIPVNIIIGHENKSWSDRFWAHGTVLSKRNAKKRSMGHCIHL